MAATCSSVLALMDAGVPLKAPVSGIAMGLMMDGDTPYVLSDIADAEDGYSHFAPPVTVILTLSEAKRKDLKIQTLYSEILRRLRGSG